MGTVRVVEGMVMKEMKEDKIIYGVEYQGPPRPCSAETALIVDWKNKIETMSHVELARLWRFAPVGHPVFRKDLVLFDLFQKRFRGLGGWTPEISKAIG